MGIRKTNPVGEFDGLGLCSEFKLKVIDAVWEALNTDDELQVAMTMEDMSGGTYFSIGCFLPDNDEIDAAWAAEGGEIHGE